MRPLTQKQQVLTVEPLPPASPAKPLRVRGRNPLFAAFWWLERHVSFVVADRILPNIPGVHRLYDRHLRKQLRLSTATVTIQGLDQEWRGARILLLSDFHTGPFLSCEALKRALEKLCELEPDLIVFAGDLVSNRFDEFDSHLDAIAQLQAKHGVYAVLGNHDHYCGEPEGIRLKLGELGIRVLHNQTEVVTREGDRTHGSLYLAGIDDLGHGRPDLETALVGVPDGKPVLLVSHNPDVLFEAADLGISLVLAGHTHGGQIRIPGLPPLITMSQHRFSSGHFVWRDTSMIVSRGMGVVGIPVRFRCPPEAVLIELEGSD